MGQDGERRRSLVLPRRVRRSALDRSSSLPVDDGKEVLSVESRDEPSTFIHLVVAVQLADELCRLPALVEDYLSGKLNVEAYITHTVRSLSSPSHHL